MGTKRKPSLDDAGKVVYKIYRKNDDESIYPSWESLELDERRVWIKQALEVWREVEKAI